MQHPFSPEDYSNRLGRKLRIKYHPHSHNIVIGYRSISQCSCDFRKRCFHPRRMKLSCAERGSRGFRGSGAIYEKGLSKQYYMYSMTIPRSILTLLAIPSWMRVYPLRCVSSLWCSVPRERTPTRRHTWHRHLQMRQLPGAPRRRRYALSSPPPPPTFWCSRRALIC